MTVKHCVTVITTRIEVN